MSTEELPLWKLIARARCRHVPPNCTKCLERNACLSGSKAAANAIKRAYHLTRRIKDFENANIIDEIYN